MAPVSPGEPAGAVPRAGLSAGPRSLRPDPVAGRRQRQAAGDAHRGGGAGLALRRGAAAAAAPVRPALDTARDDGHGGHDAHDRHDDGARPLDGALDRGGDADRGRARPDRPRAGLGRARDEHARPRPPACEPERRRRAQRRHGLSLRDAGTGPARRARAGHRRLEVGRGRRAVGVRRRAAAGLADGLDLWQARRAPAPPLRSGLWHGELSHTGAHCADIRLGAADQGLRLSCRVRCGPGDAPRRAPAQREPRRRAVQQRSRRRESGQDLGLHGELGARLRA